MVCPRYITFAAKENEFDHVPPRANIAGEQQVMLTVPHDWVWVEE